MSSTDRASQFERVIRSGGVVLFPSDTVYGLACDPDNAAAVERLYALKGRAPEKAAAIMYFDLEAALQALPELGWKTRRALRGLMPGPVTALVPNPQRRFPLAARADPGSLGLRVVEVPALAGARVAVLQSSANPSGDADPCRIAEVTPAMRAGVDLEIDGGELPGRPSTVVDLRRYEDDESWSIVRHGAVSEALVRSLLGAEHVFDPDLYDIDVIDEVHDYEELQEQLLAATRVDGVGRILELGTGTGETTRRLLRGHPDAIVVGVDSTPAMAAAAVRTLPPERFTVRIGLLQEQLPAGPFDVVASALTVHHLDDAEKADLFRRVWGVLRPGGRFVLADLVVPDDSADAAVETTHGFDKPSGADDQLGWLREAGFEAHVVWERGDLAVIVADRGR